MVTFASRVQIDVWAFSNADEVELIVNGKSLGRSPSGNYSHAQWPQVGVDERIPFVRVWYYMTVDFVCVLEISAATRTPNGLRLMWNRLQILPVFTVLHVICLCICFRYCCWQFSTRNAW